MLNIAVLGSGSGTNFDAIAKYFARPDKKNIAKIVCVISDIPGAGILGKAKRMGIRAELAACAAFRTKLDSAAEEKYVDIMKSSGAELVVLAGFMRIVKQGILHAFPGRVINIHPALLPAFPGLKSWEQAFDHGAKVTGCTVHFVDEGIDSGPIIAQRVVSIENGDTAETVHEKIQVQEHEIYSKVIEAIALGKVAVNGRRVIVKGGNL
jgi:phosphoribosylglycinamide formyltransferase 1